MRKLSRAVREDFRGQLPLKSQALKSQHVREAYLHLNETHTPRPPLPQHDSLLLDLALLSIAFLTLCNHIFINFHSHCQALPVSRDHLRFIYQCVFRT